MTDVVEKIKHDRAFQIVIALLGLSLSSLAYGAFWMGSIETKVAQNIATITVQDKLIREGRDAAVANSTKLDMLIHQQTRIFNLPPAPVPAPPAVLNP